MSATGTVPDGVKPKGIKTGRNLPAAIGVGVVLGGLAVLTLLTVKATFLIYMGAALAVALRELDSAMRTRDIRIPVIPVALGGAAMLTAGYWAAGGAVAAAFALTVVAILAWRMPGGTDGYVRDISAGILAAAYLPLLGSAVSAMLAAGDGGKRVLAFIILTVCSDIGGYFAGITLARNGGHKMVPVISPKKTWEGLAGSAAATIGAGAILLPALLHGYWWQGIIVGAAALVAAVVGDLAESMIKRDLDIKDMGTLLPGHGGILDRLDSLLLCAPVVWLLLSLFLKSLFVSLAGKLADHVRDALVQGEPVRPLDLVAGQVGHPAVEVGAGEGRGHEVIAGHRDQLHGHPCDPLPRSREALEDVHPVQVDPGHGVVGQRVGRMTVAGRDSFHSPQQIRPGAGQPQPPSQRGDHGYLEEPDIPGVHRLQQELEEPPR